MKTFSKFLKTSLPAKFQEVVWLFFFDPSIFSHYKNYLSSCEILKYDERFVPEQPRKILSSQGEKLVLFYSVPALMFFSHFKVSSPHTLSVPSNNMTASQSCRVNPHPRPNWFSLLDILLLLILKPLIWYLISYCI